MDIQELADLDDEQFAEVVRLCIHVKTADPQVWEALTSAEMVERTRLTLATVFQRVSGQIRHRKAKREEFRQECFRKGPEGKTEWFATMPEFDDWRNRAGNFCAAVQARIAEANRIQKKINRSNNHLNMDHTRNVLRLLAVAVQKHQAAHARAGGIAEQCDYELWKTLEALSIPVRGGSASLRAMLDVVWFDVDPVTAEGAETEMNEQMMRAAPASRSFTGVPRARHVGSERKLA